MFMHLIKLIWNRKAANLLIMTEVAITFMVLFAIISMGRHYYQSYKAPLGFHWQNTWAISINSNGSKDYAVQLKKVVEVLRGQNEITSVGVSDNAILRNSWSSNSRVYEGRQIDFNALTVSDNAFKDWGVELVAGRWFGPQDNEQHYKPVMVNQLFVDKYFSDKDPINVEIPNRSTENDLPSRIVGVYQDFRQRGDFAQPVPYVINRYRLDKGGKYTMRNIHITFEKRQSAAFEGTLLKVLKGTSPSWDFHIRSWRSLRQSLLNKVLVPMVLVSLVVGFLLLMVAMGLLGVLWQNINQRTGEIGLRRALGASKMSIGWQIIGELVTLAGLSMLLASIVLVQVPLLSLVETVSWGNFWFSLFSAMATILAIVILCALYPSRVAIKMAPALALHYE